MPNTQNSPGLSLSQQLHFRDPGVSLTEGKQFSGELRGKVAQVGTLVGPLVGEDHVVGGGQTNMPY